MLLPPTLCDVCIHDQGDQLCAAFPDGIPSEIFFGERDHDSPYPGDGGLRFELDPEDRPLYALIMERRERQ